MSKKVPARMCVACREMKPKRELIRVVLNSDGNIALDTTGKKAGRGAYVCRNRLCMGEALKTNKFDRGLKKKLGKEVIEQLIAEMEALPIEEK